MPFPVMRKASETADQNRSYRFAVASAWCLSQQQTVNIDVAENHCLREKNSDDLGKGPPARGITCLRRCPCAGQQPEAAAVDNTELKPKSRPQRGASLLIGASGRLDHPRPAQKEAVLWL